VLSTRGDKLASGLGDKGRTLAGELAWIVVDIIYAKSVSIIFNGDSGMGRGVGQKNERLIYCIG